MTARTLTIVLSFIAFIALGLPDALLGIAWPFMRIELNQPLAAGGLIVLVGTLGSAASGVFSSAAQRHIGIGQLLALSCLLTGLALLGYTLFKRFELIIACAVAIGVAAGATDATVNAYVAKHFSARLMQWLHASFGVGITFGPIIMTAILAMNLPWQSGYQIHAGLQLALMLLFLFTAFLWLSSKALPGSAEGDSHADVTSVFSSLRNARVWLGMLIFFLYCGLEYSVGLWTFSLLTETREVSAGQAALWVSLYWAMFTAGRIVMGFVTARHSPHRIILFSLVLALIGTLIFIFGDTPLMTVVALVVIGFAYAPLYPAMVSTTEDRVSSQHFANAMGLQVTGASLGIVVIPASIGLIATSTSLSVFPWCLLLVTVALLCTVVSALMLASSAAKNHD